MRQKRFAGRGVPGRFVVRLWFLRRNARRHLRCDLPLGSDQILLVAFGPRNWRGWWDPCGRLRLMKPRPRVRRMVKWGGAVVTVLLMVVWISSRWFVYTWAWSGGRYVLLAGGVVQGGRFAYTDPETEPDTAAYSARQFQRVNRRWDDRVEFRWRPAMASSYMGPTMECPLWMPAAVVAIVTLFAWRLDASAGRRGRLNLCPKCGYDRAGIAGDARCPECGANGSVSKPTESATHA